jgi:hypothetical protein
MWFLQHWSWLDKDRRLSMLVRVLMRRIDFAAEFHASAVRHLTITTDIDTYS